MHFVSHSDLCHRVRGWGTEVRPSSKKVECPARVARHPSICGAIHRPWPHWWNYHELDPMELPLPSKASGCGRIPLGSDRPGRGESRIQDLRSRGRGPGRVALVVQRQFSDVSSARALVLAPHNLQRLCGAICFYASMFS